LVKLPSYRRIFHDDYPPETQEIIKKLSVSLNIGVESLYEALNGKLNFEDNFNATTKDVEFAVDSNGIPIGDASMQIGNTETISGLQIIKYENLTNPASYPTGGITICYTQSADIITFDHVSGLPEGENVRLRVIALG